MAKAKKTSDQHIPAANPILEDFWDPDDEHDLQAMVEQANRDEDETV